MVERMVAVGMAGPTWVRLWARVPRPTPLLLTVVGASGQWRHLVTPRFDPEADGTCAFTFPDDCPGAPPLEPGESYRFQIHEGGEHAALVGEGRFRTAPRTPRERWCFAFLSCHQPFDDAGQPTPRALAMLEAASAAIDEHDPELVLFVGDQIYADRPRALSLFEPRAGQTPILDAPAHEVRRRYQAQYRRFWDQPAWQRLHARAATVCVPDDHEVIDNWGSRAAFEDPRWRALAKSALEAAFDYQGRRAVGLPRPKPGEPPLFEQGFAWGNAAFFVLDVRSRRVSSDEEETRPGQIVDGGQLVALASFLANHHDAAVVFLAVPVPLVHVPDWITRAAEAVTSEGRETDDRWSSAQFVHTRDALLALLEDHRRVAGGQRVVVLSGDIHAGWAVALDTGDHSQAPPILQLVSSAITNGESSLTGKLSELFLRTTDVLGREVGPFRVRTLPGVEANDANPYGGLNMGFVEVARAQGGGATVRFRLVSHAEPEVGRPVVVFDSGPL